MIESCVHDFQHGGIKYDVGDLIGGTSRHKIVYFDWFYCRKCTESIYRPLPTDYSDDDYHPIKYNATPRGH